MWRVIRRSSWRCAARVALGAVLAIVGYAIMVPRYYHYTAEFLVQAQPKDVWEFVADFSNMPKLNPTIQDWELLSERGDYGHWQYSVRYTEHLSGLPTVTNYATAHFEVKPAKGGSDYIVTSTHSTCFYSDLFCLPAVSEFRFRPNTSGRFGRSGPGAFTTLCVEDIYYSCPWLFSGFCQKEVIFQREAIRENLRSEMEASAGDKELT